MNFNYSISTEEYNKILAHSDKTVKKEKELMNILEQAIKQLSKYNGKAITKRFESYVSIEGYTTHYYKSYEWHYLRFYKDNENIEFSLNNYNREATKVLFDVEYLNNKLKDTKEKYEKDIKELDRLAEYITVFNTALKWFKKAQDDINKIPGIYSYNRF